MLIRCNTQGLAVSLLTTFNELDKKVYWKKEICDY